MFALKIIRVLQLGTKSYSEFMKVSDCAQWYYEPDLSTLSKQDFDIAILDREVTEDEFDYLIQFLRAYTLFITRNVPMEENSLTRQLMIRKKGQQVLPEELGALLSDGLPDYFPDSYGEKYQPHNLAVAQEFRGKVFWRGFECVELDGDFGEDLTQVLFWRNNLPIDAGQAIEFWLEYSKDPGIEVSLEIKVFYFQYGTIPASIKTWSFSEKELENVVYIENKEEKSGHIFTALNAKGNGSLTVTALHDRHSRRGKGAFLPGGERRVASNREEIFCYFDPGNLKPPLNVYFSGYKTREGFEGYYMLKRIGHPFLLITDTRLEGGAFYMGSEEYENILEQTIRDHMEELGFHRSEVILSGISGGAFGALYYGCRIQPHTILIGKPLANIGDVAANERLNRPGVFPASLDMLHKFCGSLDRNAVERLNAHFWDAFDRVKWSSTQFAVAYMIEDDYDSKAYGMLQSHLKGSNVRIFGKGLHGRHNDDTDGIVSWFAKQYSKIVQNSFGNEQSETGGRG